jgi:hypothetical protein
LLNRSTYYHVEISSRLYGRRRSTPATAQTPGFRGRPLTVLHVVDEIRYSLNFVLRNHAQQGKVMVRETQLADRTAIECFNENARHTVVSSCTSITRHNRTSK